MRSTLIVLTATLALSACDLGPGDDPVMTPQQTASSAPAQPAPEAPTRSAEPIGDPVQVAQQPASRLQEAAAVDTVHRMPNQGAKVFGIAGGDPAVNGIMTYLALFIDPAEGWRTYEVGNFEFWRVTEEAEGRVVLDVRESRLDAAGEIVTDSRRFIVTWARDGEAPPAVISVTPAR